MISQSYYAVIHSCCLTADHLRGIAMISQEVSYPAQTLIFREGEEACCLYVPRLGRGGTAL